MAEWKDRAVIAKIHFAPRNHERHALDEVRGHETFRRKGITTPRLLFHDREREGRAHVLIYEKIEPTVDLDHFIRHGPQPGLSPNAVMEAVMKAWAHLHKQGGFHKDPHAGNFLVRRNTVFLLDPAAVTWIREPVGRERALKGLGMWFAQWGFIGSDALRNYFGIYTEKRGWTESPEDLKALQRITRAAERRRIGRFLRKCFRNSTDFTASTSRSWSWVCLRKHSRRWERDLSRIDRCMEEGRPLKLGNTCTVVRAEFCDRTLVVKRYNVKSRGHRIKRMLQNSRAARVWKYAQRLRFIGIPTAEPIGFAERRSWGRPTVSYFVSEFIPGLSLREHLSRPGLKTSELEKTARRVGRLFLDLKKAHLCQADLKADNIRVHEDGVHLIDLDSMRFHRTARSLDRAWSRAWNRFMKNWEDLPAIGRLFSRMDLVHEDHVPLPGDQ